MADEDEEAIARQVLDVLTDAVAGTDWAPPEGGVLTEAVVVLGFMHADGGRGWSWIGSGSAWASEGLLRSALRRIDEGARLDFREMRDEP